MDTIIIIFSLLALSIYLLVFRLKLGEVNMVEYKWPRIFLLIVSAILIHFAVMQLNSWLKIWPESVLENHFEELVATSLIVFASAVGISYFLRIWTLALLSKGDEIDEWDEFVYDRYDSETDPILSAKEIN